MQPWAMELLFGDRPDASDMPAQIRKHRLTGLPRSARRRDRSTPLSQGCLVQTWAMEFFSKIVRTLADWHRFPSRRDMPTRVRKRRLDGLPRSARRRDRSTPLPQGCFLQSWAMEFGIVIVRTLVKWRRRELFRMTIHPQEKMLICRNKR